MNSKKGGRDRGVKIVSCVRSEKFQQIKKRDGFACFRQDGGGGEKKLKKQ